MFSMLLVGGLMAGCLGLLLWALLPDPSERAIHERLASALPSVDSEGDAPQKRSKLAQWLGVLAPINGSPTLDQFRQRLGSHLVSGHVRLNALEFLALQEILAVAAAGLYVLWASPKVNWLILMGCGTGGFVIPHLWLRSHIKKRHQAIARDLPEIVDLLSLCVEAGTDFMGALNRVIKEFRKCPLVEELMIVLNEIRVGRRRRDALRALARRVQIPEISSLARTLVQADRMGTGIAEALRILSEETRMHRFHRGDRLAQQAPIKMLIPLIFFIMPTVAIVVGAPILLQFLRGSMLPKM